MEEKLFEEFYKLDLFKENEDDINDLIDYIINPLDDGDIDLVSDLATTWCEYNLEENFEKKEVKDVFEKIFKKVLDEDAFEKFSKKISSEYSDDEEYDDSDDEEYDDSDVNKNDSINTLKKVIDLNKVYNCFSDIDIPVGSKGYFSNRLYNIAVQIKEKSKKYSLKEVNATSNEEDVFKSSDGNWYSYFYCTSTFEIIPFDFNDNLIGKTLESKKLGIKSTILAQSKGSVFFVNKLNIDGYSYEYLMKEDKDFTIDGKKCHKIKIVSK